MSETKGAKLENHQIHKYASIIASDFILYNSELWEYISGQGWTNIAKNKINDISKILRKRVKTFLMSQHSKTNNFSPMDIDNVYKEVMTDVHGRIFNDEDIKSGFYFLNGRLYLNEKKEFVFEEGTKDFSPLTIKFDYNQLEYDIAESMFNESNICKMLKNISEDKYQLLFEFLGYIYANEHAGVALLIDGKSSIGKSTIAMIVNYSFYKTKNSEMIEVIDSKDFMTDKADQFYLSNAYDKQIIFINEGGTYFTNNKIKEFNKNIDETSETIFIRRMYKGNVAYPKRMNFIMAMNGPYDAQAENEETLVAHKNRIISIVSKANNGVLNLSEYNKMFTDDEMEPFIYMCLKGYRNTKIKNKERRKKFSDDDSDKFWQITEDSNLAGEIIESGGYKNKRGETNEEAKILAEAWNAKKLPKLTNRDIELLITHYKDSGRILNNKYNAQTFKREIQKLKSEDIEEIVSKKINIDGKSYNGIYIEWKSK